MRFVIEQFNEHEQEYGPAVVGDSGDATGDQKIAKAFENAEIATAGCYRVRREDTPNDPAFFYELTREDKLFPLEEPCS